jgi:hypothetical protein
MTIEQINEKIETPVVQVEQLNTTETPKVESVAVAATQEVSAEKLEAPAQVVEAVVEVKEQLAVEVAVETPQVEAKAPETLTAQVAEKSADDLKEQLTVIREVRTELAKAYNDNKELSITSEKLSKEVEQLKEQLKSMESLKSEIEAFKAKEAEVEKLAYDKKLEKLSADFKSLGQDKSVEQLSALDKNTVEELSKVTELALNSKKDSEQLVSVTVPTQAIAHAPIKAIEQKKVPEQLSKDDFLKGLCNALTAQQK